MRLTVFSDYALRVLIYVALQGERRSTVAEIADVYAVSHSHLTKVVQSLASLGYLKTVRGKGGGLTLDKPPADIRIGTLLQATEAGSAMVECMGEAGACRITAACALPKIFERATASFYAVLDDYTLADLIAKPEWLNALLATGCSPSLQELRPGNGEGTTLVSNKREK